MRLGEPPSNYVLSIDAERNRIVVGDRGELRVDSFKISGINMLKELDSFDWPMVKIGFLNRGCPMLLYFRWGIWVC